ncbi:MAG: M23 family metallopeptidase [bacterium]|nr:M23 family metallopeptidase [bacterium]
MCAERQDEVTIARSFKRTFIAIGLKAIEWCFPILHGINHAGRALSSAACASGGFFVRMAIPLYRVWWMFRRASMQQRGGELLASVLMNRTTVQVAFAVLLLLVAVQSLQAREYGGFVGERPLLRAFITSEDPSLQEEVIAGPAAPTAEPSFRAASIQALVPTVLGAEVVRAAAPQISGYALMQPVLTDTAVEDHGRQGVSLYTVELGDTTSTIAERFGLRTSTVLWTNNLSSSSFIRPGQTLKVLPADGVLHTVKRGDTLEKIAKTYEANAEEVLEFNRLVDADDIEPGDALIVVGGKPKAATPTPRPAKAIAKAVAMPLPEIPGKFFWPSTATYRISQYFTWRHHGVDIAIAQGTPIYASDPGTVVSSGWLSGYGYQVTIEHGNGLKTRYAHSSKLLVAKGQQVDRGQQIALVGSTGRSTGPHIHYEVFANGARVNPFQYLR